ncbi:MFS transporter [Actinoplanes sp. RD1]|uniref:MFS transporter n=1 Tax=Actinoplanes sp. RD1 TaxID=3064538 RepID=UPI0027405433|nr:MFS transporter [Actinoplanes sp. RD1]
MELRVTETRAWTGLAVLVLPCFLVSMDGNVLNLALPAITADLRPSGAELLWIADGYVFLVAGALLAMGALGDRIGRRRLLLAGAALFTCASLGAACARTPGQLILARVLMGLAGASLMPSTLALIRGLFPDGRQRTTALGAWTASFSLGGLLGPLIGGVLLTRFWWGAVFLIAVPATLLLLLVGPRLLPEIRDPHPPGFDLLGAAQSLAAVLLTVYGVKHAAAGGGLPQAGGAIVAGVLLGTAFVRRQRRLPRPMIDPALLRGRPVRIALISSAVIFFALYGTQVAQAQHLQTALGLDPLRAALWTVPSVVAYFAGTLLAPRLVPQLRAIRVSLAVAAAGCALVTLIVTDVVPDLAAIVLGSAVFGLGLAPVYTLSTDIVVTHAPASQAGVAGAVAESSAELGGALGIALLGALGVAVHGSSGAASGHAYATISGAAALIVAAALLAVTLLARGHAARGQGISPAGTPRGRGFSPASAPGRPGVKLTLSGTRRAPQGTPPAGRGGRDGRRRG